MSVLAVVLTHSSPSALEACVRAILAQHLVPDEVLVVDNASAPMASTTLAATGLLDPRVRVLRVDTNDGPAGGHAIGLRAFAGGEHDLAWVMDDDCVPAPSCLAELVGAARDDGRRAFVFPTWVQPDGAAIVRPAWCGFLIGADVVGAVGLPRAELVWWAEDTEYLLWRIPSAGFARRHAAAAVVQHTKVRATRFRPAWKYYYEVRNTIYLRTRLRRSPRKIPRIVAVLVGRVLFLERDRGRKLLMVARGVVDGVAGRLGARVALPQPSASKRVLHVLPVDLARGAQSYARALRDALDSDAVEHRTLALYAGTPGALAPDIALDVPSGALRRWAIDPRAVVRLRRALRHRPADVVVAHGGEPLLCVALAAPRGTKIVYYRVGVFSRSGERGVRRLAYLLATRRCARVAGVSEPTLEEARTVLRVDPADLWLIPNGRDPAPFAGTARRDGATVRLLWVGQLTEGKRPFWFVDVVRALRARGLTVEGSIAGDGPLYAAVAATAATEGIATLGRRDDVPALMGDADVICFTSRGDAEGMPGVLIEAALAARPVVATRVTGVDDVVVDGTTGFVVDVDDRDGYAAAVARLVLAPDVRRRFGAAAREHALRNFTLDISTGRWQALLAELMA